MRTVPRAAFLLSLAAALGACAPTLTVGITKDRALQVHQSTQGVIPSDADAEAVRVRFCESVEEQLRAVIDPWKSDLALLCHLRSNTQEDKALLEAQIAVDVEQLNLRVRELRVAGRNASCEVPFDLAWFVDLNEEIRSLECLP